MTKISKHEVRDYIIEISKKLFLEKGFINTSFRDIAKEGDLTLGRIYVYFKKKDDLFLVVISPILEIMENMSLNKLEDCEVEMKINSLFNKKAIFESMCEYGNLIKKYREELDLILFKSDGFYLIDFRKMIKDKYIENFMSVIDILKEKDVIDDIYFPRQLLNSLAMIYISLFEEITKNEMSDFEFEKYIEKLTDFIYYGNLGILGKVREEKLK